jgi:hypothetical protein
VLCVCPPEVGIDLTPSDATRASFFFITYKSYVACIITSEMGAPFTQSSEIFHGCRSDKYAAYISVICL